MTSADGVAYYGMMKRVSAKCKMLREVKVRPPLPNPSHIVTFG